MELAFEGGHRWFDLIRYDENGEYAKVFFTSIGKSNFTLPKHLLLPVPSDDIDANSNLLRIIRAIKQKRYFTDIVLSPIYINPI